MGKKKKILSVAEFARMAGEHPINIHRWLKGERKITLLKAKEIEEKTKIKKEVFIDPALQEKYFGRTWLDEVHSD